MKTKLNGLRLNRVRVSSKHPVGLTALMSLKQAIQQELYEECASIIEIAREFGISNQDIQSILEDPRRNPIG